MSFIAAGIIYSASFVAPTRSADAPQPAAAPAGRKAVARQSAPAAAGKLSAALPGSAFGFAPLFQAGAESVATYAADCVTPKDEFNLGETVCVQVTNAPPPFRITRPLRRVAWVGPANIKRQQADITANPQTNSFTLPSSLTSSVGGGAVDNRGEWAVVLTGTSGGSAVAKAVFNVKDPNNAAANLSVTSAPIDGEVLANGNAGFRIHVTNRGPDDAASVQLSDAAPLNTTFVSGGQDSGPSFACTNPSAGSTGTSNCTIASLPAGSEAAFTFIYKVGSTVPVKTIISNTAAVVSTTTDPRPTDNASVAEAVVTAVTAETDCLLECPSDILVAADTTQDPDGEGPAAPVSGAFVTFSAAEPFGACGTITASHPSGSFFPVGTTSVTSTSSTGGGFCTFNVTVTSGGGPTISCPADIVTNADDGCTANVANLGTPTTTGSGVTVEGVRSDDDALGAPYPAGTTTITWRATDDVGRSATCTQTVTVNSSGTDAAPPTITAPADVTYTTGTAGGACGLIVTESELGEATATDDGCAVTISRTGVPAGNFFPVGQTTVTWKATDASGKTATATQVVTIVENTPPVIHAPGDASYACLSEVPAASASQATGAGSFDGNGNPVPGPPSDNCGVPVVTISESVTGAGNSASPRVITRTFTATDAAGNTASDDQVITVIDDAPPVVTAPANVSTDAAANSCSASVDPGTASVTDNCSGATVVGTRSDNQPLNAPYPGGTTTITWTGTDANGNTATASQTVTVNDVTAPVLNVNGANPLTVECHTPFNDPGATAADACDTSITVSASGVVNADVPGTYTVTYNASDDAGNAAAPVTRTVNVVDTTAPVVTLNGPATMTVECHTSFADPGATAADSCAGTTPVATSGSVNVNTPGTYVLTYTATDGSNNTGSATRTVNVVDTTPPVMDCPDNVVVSLPLNSTATSMAVTYPAATATDSCGGALPVTYSQASGSVFGVGTTTVTATATDAAGNTASCTFTVTVLYNFTGFFSPVSNVPTLNSVNAGRTIPVKFSLSGNKGLGIMAAGYPASQQVACNSSAPISELEGTETSGGSTLAYSPDQYHYNWKTEGGWAGTCRALVVKLNDGTAHTAFFKFK